MFKISIENLISRLFEISCLGLLIRFIAIGADIGSSIATISIVISICYKQWLIKEQISDKKSIENKMDELDKKMEQLFQKAENHTNDVANKIQAVSLDRSIRRVNNINEQTQDIAATTKRFF